MLAALDRFMEIFDIPVKLGNYLTPFHQPMLRISGVDDEMDLNLYGSMISNTLSDYLEECQTVLGYGKSDVYTIVFYHFCLVCLC